MPIEPKTRVIFRKFKDGDVIAIFPDIFGSSTYDMLSYMHVGQHGACDCGIVQRTKLAIIEDYASLQKELSSIGYNLQICKRIPSNSLQKRKNEIR